jgi:hypothetical protein
MTFLLTHKTCAQSLLDIRFLDLYGDLLHK